MAEQRFRCSLCGLVVTERNKGSHWDSTVQGFCAGTFQPVEPQIRRTDPRYVEPEPKPTKIGPAQATILTYLNQVEAASVKNISQECHLPLEQTKTALGGLWSHGFIHKPAGRLFADSEVSLTERGRQYLQAGISLRKNR